MGLFLFDTYHRFARRSDDELPSELEHACSKFKTVNKKTKYDYSTTTAVCRVDATSPTRFHNYVLKMIVSITVLSSFHFSACLLLYSFSDWIPSFSIIIRPKDRMVFR